MIVLNKREEIDRLLVGKEYLKGGLLYCRSVDEVKGILELSYFDNPKYRHLLTSNIWQSNVSDIVNILSMKEWDDPRFKGLLTSSIWNYNADNIKKSS